jgi:hypothetical protein
MFIVCLFVFTTLDPTVDEFGEDENFKELEEDQGQANQGEPSILVAHLDPSFTYACFSNYVLYKMHSF